MFAVQYTYYKFGIGTIKGSGMAALGQMVAISTQLGERLGCG